MVIVAILATQVVFSFTDSMARVKAAAFNLRADMNLARAEAVNRHANVVVKFMPGATDDGYRIYTEADNETIKRVGFRDEVQFYDAAAVDGPTKTPDNTDLTGSAGDGIIFAGNAFRMRPDGTSDTADDNDTVIIYGPDPGDHTVMRAPPIAIVVSPNTGRVRLERWRKEEGAWKEK